MKLLSHILLALGLAAGASQTLRAQFVSVDLGGPASAGSTTVSGTTITNTGGGADIWGTADQCHYYYTNVVGNYDVKCRFLVLSNTPTTGYANAWVKGELMARLPDPTLATAVANAGDPMFAMMTTRTNTAASGNIAVGQNEVNIQYRAARNQGANWPGTPPNVLQPWSKITPTYPNQWLRVQRIGSVMFGYTGNNGTTWKLVYTADTANDPAWMTPEGSGITNAWGTTNLIGLAITSHDNTAGRTAYSVSDNLTFTAGLLTNAIGDRLGFTLLAGVTGADYITNVTQVKLDGADITSLVTVTNSAGLPAETTVIFPGFGTNQVPNSQHTVALTVQTYQNQTLTAASVPYTVPNFSTLTTNAVVPVALSSLDTTQVGFAVRSWQSHQYEPNAFRWAEEQVIGLRGANIADQTSADSAGFFAWTNAVLLGSVSTSAGPFLYDTNFAQAWSDLNPFGIGLNGTDNSALELFTWMYFPTQGVYQIYVGSDDYFAITMSGTHPLDRMGTTVMSFNAAQTPATFTAYNQQWVINQPGAYPVRILWENASGGAGLQLYGAYPSGYGTNIYIPVNDDGRISGYASPIQCFRPSASSVAGPYVKKANPVKDGQNVTFFQPIVVDLGDGLGGLTVATNAIVLKVDNVAQTLAVSQPGAGTTRVVSQMGTNLWATGAHTILLTFSDSLSNSYSYTWPFTVISVPPTSPATVQIPLASMVPTNVIDFSQAGFRVHSYQTVAYQANRHGWTEEQIEGLRGPNVADQTMTYGTGYYVWQDLLDFLSNGGFTGEYNYNNSFATFGINNGNITYPPSAPIYSYPWWDNCALEIGAWLVFPKAGTYMMMVNSDDGWQVSCPVGSPFSRLGTVVGLRDAGSLSGGPNGGALVGNTAQYFSFTIPAAGAYPFRLLWENGTGGLGVEWSIYQYLPDGSVAKMPVNDAAQPDAIKAYQTTTGGDSTAPYVKYVNPAPDTQNAVFYSPVVADLVDSTGRTVNTNSIVLTVDNVPRPLTITQSNTTPTVTHVVQQLTVPWQTGSHTNVLTYLDNVGTGYTNTWVFSVINVLPYGIINIPLTNMVATNTIDFAKPGFLIHTWQVTNAPANSSVWVEQALMGLQSTTNLADQTSATNAFGSIAWPDVLDFGGNGQNGEWGYNSYAYGGLLYGNAAAGGAVFTNILGFYSQGGAPNVNWNMMEIGAWLVFPRAGNYIMHANPDDEFRLTAPSGNPFNKVGTVVMWREATGGQGGASVGQVGGTYATINIPAPGAYPFRLLWWNISGGFGVEWSIYQYRADGSVEKILINDTNNPNSILAYQISSQDSPYVKNINPVPASAVGAAPAMTFGSGYGQTDFTLDLADGFTTVNTNSIMLSFQGASQPITITQPTNGLTHILRSATNFWPSGAFGPLTLSYQDSLGKTYSVSWNIATSFWGSLTNGLALGLGDTNAPGFKLRAYQLDPKATAGTTVIPTRVHVAEQILAGLWGANVAKTTNLTDGIYWDWIGTGPTNGTINFNLPGQAQIGSFQSPNYPDRLFPGIPGAVTATVNSDTNNDYVFEYLAYVEFPTNGTYTLGVNSDDGFRLTRGWAPPANFGALLVNAPSGVTGFKPTVQNSYLASYSITNPVTGNLVLANGAGYGSTTNGEGCVISNPGALAGNIALMYRSAYCGYVQQVQNAAAAGAIGVVFIQNRPSTEGPFPQEPGVTPIQPIPAVQIEQADGNTLAAILATNGTVNVTLTPMDYLVNPPADLSPLGQADVGKGASDVLFPVVVQQAGTYPLRLIYFQGGGGGNCEFFSYVGGTKVLINDLTQGGLRAYYSLVHPGLSITSDGTNLTVTYGGTLQTSTDLVNWTDVAGSSSLVIPLNSAGAQAFFRAKMVQ